ncbi:hypothetical protein DPV78_000258 [Talaromyces pinophilus]|nr:hypothetical protein DPV78_000258 [Talaromyces pinophilus]
MRTKSFLYYYKVATRVPLDKELDKKINKISSKYILGTISLSLIEFKLDTDEKEKTLIYIKDLVPLQETVL